MSSTIITVKHTRITPPTVRTNFLNIFCRIFYFIPALILCILGTIACFKKQESNFLGAKSFIPLLIPILFFIFNYFEDVIHSLGTLGVVIMLLPIIPSIIYFITYFMEENSKNRKVLKIVWWIVGIITLLAFFPLILLSFLS